jgi:GNAT superfamily N-acetyltransferase
MKFRKTFVLVAAMTPSLDSGIVEELRYELLAETDVTDEIRALAGELLVECLGVRAARDRGWANHAPDFRVLVWDGKILVGNEMGCVVDCTPPILVYGIGDAAVREGWRGRGIAKVMGLMTTDEGMRRNADALLCSTVQLGHYIVTERGWEPINAGELYLRRRFRRWKVRLVHNWYVKWGGPKIVPLTIGSLF